MKRLIFLIQSLLLTTITTFGQVDIAFEKIKLDAQTDISIVSSITQDNLGYIWAATEEGVIKYDSHKAFLYNEYTGMPKSFSNKIGDLYLDSTNTLWAASDDKIGRYNRSINLFEEVEVPEAVSIIHDILITDGILWLATYNGLWRLPLDNMMKGEQLMGSISVSRILLSGNEILLGTNSGLYRSNIDGKSQLINSDLVVTSIYRQADVYLVGTFDGELLSLSSTGAVQQQLVTTNGPVYDILYDDKRGRYYIGSDGGGLTVLDADLTIVKTELEDVNDEKSLSSNGVYDLHADNNGHIWIATYGGGINKFTTGGDPFQDVTHIANEEQSIANSFTRAILETKEGELWYGTKQGLSIYSPATGRWRHKRSFSGRVNGDIIMALEEDNESVWIATYGAGMYKVNKETLTAVSYSPSDGADVATTLDRVYALCKSNDGYVYAGGIGGLVHVIDGDKVSTLELSQVRDIAEGPSGEIVFVGRSGVQLLRGDSLQNQVSIYYQDTEFDYSTINCVVFEDTEHIWVGTNGDGLIRYNINTQEYKTINISDGLPSDMIQGIILTETDLWASTSRGLIRFDIDDADPKIEVYDEGDGMKYTSFNYGSYAALQDGRLAFGSTDGVIVVDQNIIQQTAEAPKLILESYSVLSPSAEDRIVNAPISPTNPQDIELKYTQNFIKIDFTGIDHHYPSKVRYSWQMDGMNNEWSAPNAERSVTFVGLNPGKYTLSVKTLDKNGKEGVAKSIKIIITPPWWKSWWAYLIYVLLALAALWLGVSLARALLTKRNADEQISFYNNITHELKTPLSILLTKLENATNESGNIGEIKTTVKRMNGLFDQLLNFNKVSSDYYRDQKVSKISFGKHVKLVADTFQQEMDKKDISFTFNNEWPDQYFYYKRDVLDKITFNLLSNAIKYSTKGGAIVLTAKASKGRLKMTVKDNGIGIPKDQQADILKRYYRARNAVNSQTPGTGLGLMIVKNLVEYDGGEIAFTSEEGLGSAFTVVLPSLESKYIKIDEGPGTATKTANEEATLSAPQKARILVVEDNDELRIDLVEKLSEHYSIVAARNGAEGFDKAKQKLPDLIITDLIMPEMDGNQLCEALQKDEDTNHIPVFMMTLLNSTTQKVESIKSGITSYMTKPLDFPFLIAKINSVLQYKQKLREKYLHETEIEQAHQFEDDREAQFVRKMEDFVIGRIGEESISVQDLCKHMGMSRTALYTKTKEMIDISLQNFIINTRMNHARKLLLRGGVTVKEVAFQVGFNNPKYFSTSFKKQFGESPSSFLKSLNPKI